MPTPWAGRAQVYRHALVILLTSCLVTGYAHAQSDEERAGARAAATQGANAFMERRWADAIDLFSRAESLVHSPVHLLYMARAYVQLGKLVKGRETYIKVVNEPLAGDAPAVFREAKSDAEKELSQLEPRIPYVSVVVQGAGPRAVTVTMDDVKVPPALLGVPRPVDPGEHRFQAFAEGMESNASTVSLSEGRNETVVLTLQGAQAAQSAAPVPSSAATQPQQAEPIPPTTPPEADAGGGSGLRTGAYIAFGVGAVGLVGGTVFGLGAKSNYGDAEDLCTGPGGQCPESRRSQIEQLLNDGDSKKTLAIVGFALGGAGVAAGTTLLVLSLGGEDEAAQRPSIRPWVGLGSAGVAGQF